MSLALLMTVLEADDVPKERPNNIQLLRAEEDLGLRLPDDYKGFLRHYGTGSLAAFLNVLNPASKYSGANLINAAREEDFDSYMLHKARLPEELSYDRYPKAGGLLPWGDTINGDVLYWLAKGQPEAWKIVLFPRNHDGLFLFETSMTGFLLSLIEGEIGGYFPRNVPFSDGRYVVVQE